MKFVRLAVILGLLLSLLATANAADTAAEIEYLLTTIGSSGCTFIRNDKRHSAKDAEAHLRMKYKRGKRHATTAELFIERLAASSSMSKKPYYIECSGEEPVRNSDWLTHRLRDFRGPLNNSEHPSL